MLRFFVRRLISTVLVLFAISILTFLIFQAIPNGDPALRLAGRLAQPQQIADVRKQWGFDKPIYVQYVKTMEKILDGSIISYTQQLNVEDQIRQDLPATHLAGARGGPDLAVLRDRLRRAQRGHRRALARPRA